jgi:uncharacterized membrane protein
MSTKTKRLLNIGIGCALIPVVISTYIVGAGGMAIYMVAFPVMLGVDYVQNNTTENASETTHNVLRSFINCIDSLCSPSCFYQNKEKNVQ